MNVLKINDDDDDDDNELRTKGPSCGSIENGENDGMIDSKWNRKIILAKAREHFSNNSGRHPWFGE